MNFMLINNFHGSHLDFVQNCRLMGIGGIKGVFGLRAPSPFFSQVQKLGQFFYIYIYYKEWGNGANETYYMSSAA